MTSRGGGQSIRDKAPQASTDTDKENETELAPVASEVQHQVITEPEPESKELGLLGYILWRIT